MLKFEVSNQTITRIDDFVPAAYSFNYLEAEFIFKTNDWDDCTKTAIFEFNGTPHKVELDNNNKCKVSNEVLALDCQLSKCDIRLSVIGEKSDYRITTNIKIVQINKTLYRPLIPFDSNNSSNDLDSSKIIVDDKLSVNSNNPIANSAVAKVLSGGKLAGIETIFDYESLMDFNFKYFDFENEVPLIADNEFVMLLVLDDIYDESGEYGDTECLIRKGMYIWTSSDAVSLGGITEDDIAALRNAVGQHNAAIQSINKQIETFATKELFEQISNVITLPDGHIRVDTYMLRGAGIYIIDCETTEIVIGSAKRHLLTMSKGEIFMVAESRNTGTYVRSVTAFTKQGIRHFPDVNADDLDTCRYLTNTETEKLVDEKLSALEIPVGSEGYRLITDVTTTEKTIYVLIDKDADDNAFDLKNVRVIIEAAVAQAQAVAVLCAADTYETSSDAIIASVNGGFFTSARISFYEIDAEEFGTLSHSTAKGDATAISTASTNVIYNSGVKSVDKIMIRTESASKLIPTGTRIQIWGY